MPPIATKSSSNTPQSDRSTDSEYWRSVQHLEQSEDVQRYLADEFQELTVEAGSSPDRRQFLRLLGASLALAGITNAGCRRWPVEEVRPHTSRPEGFTPGVAQHYATCIDLDGVATGVLVKSYDGRPIKIEGNPDHPFSQGATSATAQASILELYDPDRSRHVIERKPDGEQNANNEFVHNRSWADFQAFATPHFQSLRQRKGEGLAFLTQPTASPTWQRLQADFKAAMPLAKWFQYHPHHRDHEFAGSQAAHGRVLRQQLDLAKADTIVCFDADLLGSHPAHLKHARDWASGRRTADRGKMSKMYVFEPCMTVTGSVADLRVPMKPSLVEASVAYVARVLGVIPNAPNALSDHETEVLDNAIRDLESSGTAGVVTAGPAQSATTHHLVHAINQRLGTIGQCVSYSKEPLEGDRSSVEQIQELSDLLQGDVLETLVIFGGNPVYDAPSDALLNLTSSETRPLTSVHLSLHDNETSQACQWHLPAAHFLESWGDGRAWDGTYSLQQPLILPLYEGKSPIELLATLTGQSGAGLSMVRSTFDKQFPDANQRDWEQALHLGSVAGSTYPTVNPAKVEVNTSHVANSAAADWEVQFIVDAKTYDGRFANNAWLQELPDPLTKLTWDNAALMSQADADELGISTGDVVRLTCDGVGAEESAAKSSNPSIEIPIYVMPGQADGCVTLPLGYGRISAGHIGNGVGTDVYPLRTASSTYVAKKCKLAKTGRRHELVTTQEHHLLDPVANRALVQRLGEPGRPGMIVHETLLEDFHHDQHAVHGDGHVVHAAPLFDLPQGFDSPHKWGMSIDLNACIGCSGCVVACQAENNIPVVGKANVAVNREMHWLRIDRYFKGDVAEPDVVHLPMACAQCENAPCEQVCPVAATVHDAEGLNTMVYNRCIGTRYCANNCPYKVRRFNYFDYQASDPRTLAKPWLGIPDQQQTEDVSPLKAMVHNPDVTVRMRGVMEKCTYCVQRIVDARIQAKNEHARGLRESDLVADGQVRTACQASCPTQAIVFGDLNDPTSTVSQAKNNPRSYEILEGQNLGARTTYLGKIRNRSEQNT